MATLNDLTNGIKTRLTNAAQANASAPGLVGAAIVTEDTKDLQTEINTAIAKIGMLILIGEPVFEQIASELSPTSTLKITLAVAIGEIPVVWRTAANKPKAKDAALLVTQLLHNLQIPGFVNLKVTHCHFVPDKQRQLFELTIITFMTAAPLPTP